MHSGRSAQAPQSVRLLVAATDADPAGERYAQRLAERAQAAGVRWERLLLLGGQNDWNNAIADRRGA